MLAARLHWTILSLTPVGAARFHSAGRIAPATMMSLPSPVMTKLPVRAVSPVSRAIESAKATLLPVSTGFEAHDVEGVGLADGDAAEDLLAAARVDDVGSEVLRRPGEADEDAVRAAGRVGDDQVARIPLGDGDADDEHVTREADARKAAPSAATAAVSDDQDVHGDRRPRRDGHRQDDVGAAADGRRLPRIVDAPVDAGHDEIAGAEPLAQADGDRTDQIDGRTRTAGVENVAGVALQRQRSAKHLYAAGALGQDVDGHLLASERAGEHDLIAVAGEHDVGGDQLAECDSDEGRGRVAAPDGVDAGAFDSGGDHHRQAGVVAHPGRIGGEVSGRGDHPVGIAVVSTDQQIAGEEAGGEGALDRHAGVVADLRDVDGKREHRRRYHGGHADAVAAPQPVAREARDLRVLKPDVEGNEGRRAGRPGDGIVAGHDHVVADENANCDGDDGGVAVVLPQPVRGGEAAERHHRLKSRRRGRAK